MELDHVNICKIRDALFDPEGALILVLEMGAWTLQHLIECHWGRVACGPNRSNLPVIMPPNLIKSFAFQLFRGVEYLHSNFVIHRDLKPSNIVLSERGALRIIDFGLSRSILDPLKYLGDDGPVVTIWYRSPELLLGSKHYTPAVDIWSCGCILGEMLTGAPLFRGKEAQKDKEQNGTPFEEDQFEKICELMMFPKREDWPWISNCPEYSQQGELRKFHRHDKDKFQKVFNQFDPHLIDLLRSCLSWDPERRPTAKDILNHKYFTEGGSRISLDPLYGLGYSYPDKLEKEKRARDGDSTRDPKKKKY